MGKENAMTYHYVIVYHGAPYGENERGHIVSRHHKLTTAQVKYRRMFSGKTGQHSHSIYELIDGTWDRNKPLNNEGTAQ